MTRKLQTPKEIIRVLGGPTKVVELLGLTSRSVVVNWNNRKIPARYYLRIKSELEKLDFDVSPKVFGILDVLRTPDKT